MTRFLAWLDDRTGYREILHDTLYEHIPGGARWRYVWGSTLAFAFFVQLVTGVVLWAAYSPSSQTAWESVYYIQHEMAGGWLLRGIHHFMAQAMVVLLAIHLLQVVIDGAYRAPREINFWLGLVLMQIVLGLSLTGYLLPWDQKGYWATKVATNMIALTPVVGDALQKIVVGGSDYGHHTLTRFFALHAGVLPGLLTVFLVLHIALFRRHGIKAREPVTRPDSTFWPDQVLKDGVACLAVFCVVLVLVVRNAPSTDFAEVAPGVALGAELSAPADPAQNYSAARPEWYFLFLFQLLKYLQAYPPILGAIVVPGIVMATLFAMPIVGRWDLGHRFNILWTLCLMVGAGALTAVALYDDRNNQTEHSQHYLAAVRDAEREAERAVELASDGIPATGALAMLRADPQTQGPKLFAVHCAACHNHFDDSAELDEHALAFHSEDSSAANLFGFGRQRWVLGMLDPERVAGPHYFGNTALAGGEMVDWVRENIGEAQADMDEAERAELETHRQQVAHALAAQAGQPHDATEAEAGREQIVDGFSCIDCHKFHDEGEIGEGYGPDLTGYASSQWMIELISNPEHERFYPTTNDRMPAFAANREDPTSNRLTSREIELIVDWLRGAP